VETIVLASSGATTAAVLAYLVIIVGFVAGMWRVFTKAGRPGWAAVIPFYNVYVLLQVAGRPAWWLLFYVLSVFTFFVPPVSLGIALVLGIVVGIDVARRFGRGSGFGVGLGILPFIFYPILGFGAARYQGEDGQGGAGGGYCAHCGTALTPGDAFCANCGASTTPA
jgi:hypothetical protein